MADHRGFCECPVLRYAALVQKMAGCGLVAQGEYGDVSGSFVIGMLRAERGCRGPVRGFGGTFACPWDRVINGMKLVFDEDVPLLKRRGTGTAPGEYL